TPKATAVCRARRREDWAGANGTRVIGLSPWKPTACRGGRGSGARCRRIGRPAVQPAIVHQSLTQQGHGQIAPQTHQAIGVEDAAVAGRTLLHLGVSGPARAGKGLEHPWPADGLPTG
ncbi:hypothetical protein RZS08_50030, partial [Arthrospira platensis SPKY1]|nr:hypothetical protein [Arthrospira platensis SPKY1]